MIFRLLVIIFLSANDQHKKDYERSAHKCKSCKITMVIASIRSIRFRRQLIVHNDFGHRTVLVDSKTDLVCDLITVGSDSFTKRVLLACDQLAFDEVSLVRGYPFLNNISVLVNNLQSSTRQFFACCNVPL